MFGNKKFKPFLDHIKELGGENVRGKCTPLFIESSIQEIKKLYTFSSLKKTLPFVFFQMKEFVFLGIVIARQSSDLEAILASKLIRKMGKKHRDFDSSNFKIIQYRFPEDLNSLKLIVIRDWVDIEDFESITTNLQDIQSNMRRKMHQIMDKMLGEHI